MFVTSYLHEMVLFLQYIKEHLRQLPSMASSASFRNLKIEVGKFDFSKEKVVLLGHLVSAEVIAVHRDKIGSIGTAQIFENSTTLRTVPGLVVYYRRFPQDFVERLVALHVATPKNARSEWTREMNVAFEIFKARLARLPVCPFLISKDLFLVVIDASSVTVDAVHLQKRDNEKNKSCPFCKIYKE